MHVRGGAHFKCFKRRDRHISSVLREGMGTFHAWNTVIPYVYSMLPNTVDGEWDFYLFQSDEIAPPQDSLLEDASLPIEDLLAYGAFMDDFQSSMPPHPPHPPPRPPPTAVENGEEEEQEKKPVYRVIPFLKATEVVLNFPRKSLEDYMDR